MLTIHPVSIMEFESGTLLRAGQPKEEAGDVETQSCSAQTTAWGEQHLSSLKKRQLSNSVSATSPLADDTENEGIPLNKKIKTEPKDDYALAEEECARNASKLSPFGLNSEYPPSGNHDSWEVVHGSTSSPVFDRIPSFAAEECHKYTTDNCKRCIINQMPEPELDNISLHRRRQIREFEQSGEEPLRNKIRVWKEKRLEKSLVRTKPALRIDEEAMFAELKNRKDQFDEETLHHMTTRSRHASSNAEEENGLESDDSNFGYLKYLLTRGNNSTSPGSAGDENMIEEQQGVTVVTEHHQDISTADHTNITRVTARDVFQECPPERAIIPRVETHETAMAGTAKAAKVTPKKRMKSNHIGDSFIKQGEKSPNESLLVGTGASKEAKHKGTNGGSLECIEAFHSNVTCGEFEEPPNGANRGENSMVEVRGLQGSEQYISDIQRPYCNIPDDHQVTHINGVMSLPATRETRYGITLGELKRRTGYPEFLTRVDLIAYVRQSKSAGRALLDKYSIATAGQKSRPTILSKMCENEARVLGDGISKMNGEYFPWKTLARVATNKVIEGKTNETKIEQKIKAIENTRTMLKEMYDLMVENKEIPSMKTFEIASHTFGTANILNHLTVFDRLFEEYQSNLIFRRDVRNNNRKV